MYSNKLIKCKFLTNRKGSGILHVLAAMSFLFLLVYAVLTALTNSQIEQKKQTTLSTLREVQMKLRDLLTNTESWNRIVALNSSLACLNTQTCVVANPIYISHIVDSKDADFLTGLPLWTANSFVSNGFNSKGDICTTFSDGVGDPNCPFTYKIALQIVTPVVGEYGFRITARLLYNPGPNTQNRIPIQTGKMTNTVSSSVTALGSDDPTKNAVRDVTDAKSQIQDLTIGKYDVSVWRSVTTSMKSFRVVSTSQVVGTQTCSPAATYKKRNNFSVQYNPFGLVSVTGANSDTINFIRSGTYECDVTGAGYNVRSFQVRLRKTTDILPVGAGAGFAQDSGQSTVDFNTVFTIPVNGGAPPAGSFVIEQACERTMGTTDFGVNYNTPINSSLNCRIVD